MAEVDHLLGVREAADDAAGDGCAVEEESWPGNLKWEFIDKKDIGLFLQKACVLEVSMS